MEGGRFLPTEVLDMIFCQVKITISIIILVVITIVMLIHNDYSKQADVSLNLVAS